MASGVALNGVARYEGPFRFSAMTGGLPPLVGWAELFFDT